MAARTWQRIAGMFKRHPAPANMASGATLAFGADIVCQKHVEGAEELDVRRTCTFTTFGMFYTGGVASIIYRSYARVLPLVAQSTPLRFGISATLLDNFIHCPLIYTPTFYISTTLMMGHSLEYAITELRTRYFESQAACFAFWLPVMAFNFALVPPHLTVIVMQKCNFFWNIILDYLAHK
eukprot:TRINITY_DN40613_c0_g1_i1.p1 TRINITY_DN40613_c0_g1~~TRINITY_DN40613_c0_g1_i1.p1  ORF type:complete len:181 (-),score=27.12 TRINITY_DN40613_c0_g1_i1:133-675(-)